MRAVQVTRFGGPEVLRVAELHEPEAGRGEALVDVEAAGIILMDTRWRRGPAPREVPFTPGFEVGGTVRAVGEGVPAELVGRRVVAGAGSAGGYASVAVVPAKDLFAVPEELAMDQAVGVFQSGRTAIGVLRQVEVVPGESVLLTAAAGSVGSLLVQLVGSRGGRVLAAVGSASKAAFLRRLGAEVVLNYGDDGWVDAARDATEGDGARLTLECVGGEVGRGAWLATAEHGGRFLAYGWASGGGTPIGTDEIARRGITLISGLGNPSTARQRREDAEYALAEAAAGRLVAEIGGRFALAEAEQAHRLIEERANTGKLLLIP